MLPKRKMNGKIKNGLLTVYLYLNNMTSLFHNKVIIQNQSNFSECTKFHIGRIFKIYNNQIPILNSTSEEFKF